MLQQTYKIKLFIFLFSLVITNISAQSLPDSISRKIDNLFIKWDNPNTPGCAIGIVRNDSLIYAKGYGMANLEYGIQVTPQTIFEMGSVSKQFTGYSIILLARQGRLHLKDDIRKFLPWFLPYQKEKITIRNLLNHTSGVRDFMGLGIIAGVTRDDAVTHESVIRLLKQQQDLNFKPGETYSYSNSNYILLAEIVREVSGKSLRQFADSAIFSPLRMTSTHFTDNYKEIIKNRASSYRRADSANFEKSILSYAEPGPSSLLTNIVDMAKWCANFYTPKAGDQKDIEELTYPGKLNSGREIYYASGINVLSYKGWKEYFHLGSVASYRNIVITFPELKMSFIVFSNDGDYAPYPHINEIVDLLLDYKSKSKDIENAQQRDSAKATVSSINRIKKLVGDYISDDGTQINFSLNNNKFYATMWGQTTLLWEDNQDSFSYFNNPASSFLFANSGKENVVTLFLFKEDMPWTFKKFAGAPAQTDKFLQNYTGIFYCPELDVKYSIILKDHHLVLTNARTNDTQLTLVGSEHLMNDRNSMNHLVITRNNKNKIVGFEVNSDVLMHLKFNKIQR